MKTHMQVTDDYGLIPIEDNGIKYLYNRQPGDILSCEVIIQRNYQFHKKLMALFKLVHDALPDPEPVMFHGELIKPERTFDGTRKYLTVSAGYYDALGLPNGKVRIEAKSLKFNKMKQEEFDDLYSKVIDAALRVLPKNWTADEIERVALEVINFA